MDDMTYILCSECHTPDWRVVSKPPIIWVEVDNLWGLELYGFKALSVADLVILSNMDDVSAITSGMPYPTKNIGIYMPYADEVDATSSIRIDVSDQEFAGWERVNGENQLINFDDDGDAYAIKMQEILPYGGPPLQVQQYRQNGQRRQREREQRQERERQQTEQQREQQQKVCESDKQNQYNKQQTERRKLYGDVYIASDADKEEYYTMLLGKDYKDIMFFDTIMQEDIKLGDYIAEDLDNIVFIIDKIKLFSTSRAHVNTVLAHYECGEPDSMDEMLNDKLLSLSPLGCPCVGMIKYDAAKHIIVDSNFQIFALKNTKKQSKTLVSHEARYIANDYTSDAHCQSGSEKGLYQLFSPPRYI
jgi:hypothetical protein